MLLVSLSVGLSNFAGSIGIGLSGVDARTRLRVGIAFGIFEGGMPILGLLIGQAVSGSIGSYGRHLGAGLLVLTGFYTIWQSFRTGKLGRAAEEDILDTRQLLLLGLALSVDNLVVGFALGVYRVPIVLAAVMMAAISVGLSLLGLELGSQLGSRAGEYSELAGGGVLVLVGIAVGVGLI